MYKSIGFFLSFFFFGAMGFNFSRLTLGYGTGMSGSITAGYYFFFSFI